MISVLGSDKFAENLAKEIGASFSKIEKRVFPDGEICPRISGALENHVILAERMNLPLNPNRYLIGIFLILKNLRKIGVKKIDLIMPYFVYSRQNRIFRSGEPFSAQHVLELLKDSGVRNFFTVSSHTQRQKEKFKLGGIEVHNIDGFNSLTKYTKNLKLKKPVIVASDTGVKKDAEKFAKKIGSKCVAFSKHRDLKTGDIKIKGSFQIQNKSVIIIDDIISSGITMVKSIETAKYCGAKKIFCLAVHAVSESGINIVSSKSDGLAFTNTIDNPNAKISVIKDLANVIK